MTTMDQELLDIALEALAKNKSKVEKLQELSEQLESRPVYDPKLYEKDKTKVIAQLDALVKELTSRDIYDHDEYQRTTDEILADLEKLNASITDLTARDIYDSQQYKKDTLALEKAIEEVSGEVESRIKDAINSLPIPKDGIDGLPGKDGKSIEGKPGKDGKSIKGDSGTGILDIKSTASKLLIELTDGRVIDIKLPKAKEVPAGVTAMPTEIVVLRNLADVKVNGATEGQVLTYSNGKWIPTTISIPEPGIGDAVALEKRTEIEGMFKVAEFTAFKELVYTDGNITGVDIYTDSGKLTKMFSKVIGYNNSNITSILITDEINGGTLSKSISYLDGNIASVSSTYIGV